MTTDNDAASYSWPLLIEAQGQAVRASQPPLISELVEPVALFTKLVREIEAGRTLVQLAMTASEQRAAALDALALAHDVVDDARAQLVAAGFPVEDGPAGFVTTRTSCACGDVELTGDPAADDPAAGELLHSAVVCSKVVG